MCGNYIDFEQLGFSAGGPTGVPLIRIVVGDTRDPLQVRIVRFLCGKL